MRALSFLLLLASLQARGANLLNDPVFKPLWAYQGVWEVARKSLAPGAKPDRLVNQCALVGRFFACQQSVNGGPGTLLLIMPADQPGHYYTQSVMAEGRAGGRADLDINGDHWTFLGRSQEQPGKFTYYRTTNVFTGKNHIHYQQAEFVRWQAVDR